MNQQTFIVQEWQFLQSLKVWKETSAEYCSKYSKQFQSDGCNLLEGGI